eukprot:10581294-Alexandrium_andersonii.AAC.1
MQQTVGVVTQEPTAGFRRKPMVRHVEHVRQPLQHENPPLEKNFVFTVCQGVVATAEGLELRALMR